MRLLAKDKALAEANELENNELEETISLEELEKIEDELDEIEDLEEELKEACEELDQAPSAELSLEDQVKEVAAEKDEKED